MAPKDPVNTNPSPANGDENEEDGFMSFMKGKGGLMMGGGLLAIAAFALSGGGIMGLLLGLLIMGATMIFGGGLMEKAKEAINPLLPEGMREKEEPLKKIQMQVVQGLGTTENKDLAVLNIDGRNYDVKVTYMTDGKVSAVQYKPEGADDNAYKSLEGLPATGVVVGKIGANGIEINQGLTQKNIYSKIEAEVIKSGRTAAKETHEIHPYDIGNNRFLVYSKGGVASIAELTGDGFAIKDLQGNTVKDATGNDLVITGITRQEALQDGMLAREVGRALGNVSGAKGSIYFTDPNHIKSKLVRDNTVALDSALNDTPRDAALSEGKFTVDSQEATFNIVDNKLTITRNGRTTIARTLKNDELESKSIATNGSAPNYTLKPETLSKILKEELDKDDKLIAVYANVSKGLDGTTAGSGVFVHTKKGAYLIITNGDGYEIKNLNDSNDTINHTQTEKGGLIEALKYLRDKGIMPEAPSKQKDISLLAGNVGVQRFDVAPADGDLKARPFTPVGSLDRIDIPQVGTA